MKKQLQLFVSTVLMLWGFNASSQVFVESFNSGGIPSTWDNSNECSSTSTNAFWKSTGSQAPAYGAAGIIDNTGAPNSTAVWVDGSSPYPCTVNLTTDYIDVTSLTEPSIELNWFKNNTGTFPESNTFMVSVVDANGAYPLWSSTKDSTGWQKAIIDASCLGLDSFQIKLTVVKVSSSASFYNDIIVDDIKVKELDPTYSNCAAPISIASFPSPTTATINLGLPCNDGATTYVLVDTLMGTGVSLGAPIMVTNGTVELTALLPGMDYEIYAYTDCGAGSTSDTLGPHMFSTPCSALATPYTDDFDQGQYYPATSIYADDSDLGCFTTYGDYATSQEWQVASASTTSFTGPLGDANTGYGNYLYREATLGQYGVLQTPLIDLSGLTDPFFSFDYHFYGNSAANVNIRISNDYGQTWTEHKLMDESSSFASQSDPWKNTGFSLAPYANDIIYVELIVEETGSFSSNADFAIDNLSIDEAPACYNPVATLDAIVPGVNFGSVEFEFLSGKTISYSYKEVGMTTNLANGVLFTPQYTFSNLAVNKAYEFSFFNICSASFSDTFDVQVFVPSLNPCAPQTAPYVETFEITSVKRQCWTGNSGAVIDATWYVDSSYLDGANGWPYTYTTDTSYVAGEGSTFARLGTGTSDAGTDFSGDIVSGVFDFSALSTLQIDLLVTGGPYTYQYSWGGGATEPNFYIDYRTSSSGSWNRVLEYVDTVFNGWTQVSIDEPILDLSSTMEFRFGYTGGGLPIAVDSISFKQGSTCVKPVNALSYNTTTTSTDILWTGISSGYEYTYGEVLSSVSYAPVSVGSATASLSNLSPQTSYWFVVKGDCGGGTYTSLSDTLFFDTECSSIATFPYVESFESTSVYEKCWSQEKISGFPQDWDLNETGAWGSWSNTTVAYDGSEYAEGSSTSGIDRHRLISPVIDASALATLEVSFWFGHEAWGGDQNTLDLEYRLSDSDPWVTAWSSDGTSKTSWEQAYVVIPSTSSTMQIAFMETDDWGYGTVIDYITLDEGPTCLPVELAGVSDITSSSAHVTVDAPPADYEIYIELPTGVNGVPTFSQATGTTYSISNDSAMTITGLAADSTYGVFVRKICGTSVGDTADWRGPVLFKTLCDAQALPLTEMFEGADLGCWSQEDVTGSNKPWTLETGSNGFNAVSGPSEGSQYLHHTSSWGGPHIARLISPVIDVDGINTIDIAFKYDISEWFGDQNEIKVYVRSFPNGTWTEYLHLSTNTAATWTDAKVTVNVAADTNVQVAFDGIDNYGYAAALDSIYIDEGPFCPEPANVTFVPTNNSVTITWDSPNGTNSGSNIEWGSLNFVQGTGAAFGFAGDTSGVTSPFTLTGLSPDSTYSIYIQDSCSNGDVTAWIGPLTFSTSCDARVAPYHENFASIPSCWNIEDNVNSTATFANWNLVTSQNSLFYAVAPYDHTGDGSGSMGVDGSYYYSGGLPVMTTERVDVSALTDPVMSFYLSNTDYAPATAANTVVVDFYDGTTWHDSAVVADDLLLNSWKYYEVDMANYTISGDVMARFTLHYTGLLYPFYSDVLVDDVTFDERPTCYDPSDLALVNANANDANLSWTSPNATGNWLLKIEDQNTGMVTYQTTSGAASANVAGLSGGGSYCVSVAEICTNDTTFYSNIVCFTTQCGIVYAPYVQDFASYQYDFNCWTRSSNVSGTGSGSQWEGTYNDWMIGGVQDVWGNSSNSSWRSTLNNHAIGVNGSSPFSAVVTVESPEIDVTTLVKPRLEFHTISGQVGDTVITWLGDTISNGQNTLVVDMWDGASWNDSIYVNASDSVVWDTAFFELNQFTITGPVKVRFTVHKTAVIPAFDDILLDNFSITDDPAALTCADIDTAYAFDINCADAMITWGTVDTSGIFTLGSSDTNRIGTVVYVGTDSADMMANTKYFTTDTALSVDGLMPGVDYYFWAMDSCISGNTSKVIGAYMFTTATAPLPMIPAISVVNDTVGTTSDWTITLTGDTSVTYTWDIDGTAYTGSVITPSFTANGTVTATLTATNDCGSVDTTVAITVTQIGVGELDLDVANIYPNPSNGAFNVEFTSSENLDYRIELMDAMGRLVSYKEGRTSNVTEVRFDTDLPAGVYIVKTIVGTQMNVDRVTIRR